MTYPDPDHSKIDRNALDWLHMSREFAKQKFPNLTELQRASVMLRGASRSYIDNLNTTKEPLFIRYLEMCALEYARIMGPNPSSTKETPPT